MNREALEGRTVAMLEGGRSSEREVSLRTGAACAAALESRGYRVERVDVGLDVAAVLRELEPAAAFNALHGRWGEDGCIQGLLECMAVPYTGSGVTASAMAMDKVASKHLFASVGLQTPDYLVVPSEEASTFTPDASPLGVPCVVKPATEGSSVGISIVRESSGLAEAVRTAAGYRGDILLEAFIAGRELSVAVLDGESLGAIEIVPAREFYDYEAKYTVGSGTQYLYPAPIPEEVLDRVMDDAADAHRALGCSGVTRSDFILDADGEVWLLEVNTLPGMTETSLVPKIAAGRGIDFADLCERLLLGAELKT